jgi:hypothetical protein
MIDTVGNLLLFAEASFQPALLLFRFRACCGRQITPRWRGEVGLAATTQSDRLSLTVWRLHGATATVALLLLCVVLSVFRNGAWISAVAVLSAVYVVLLRIGCVDAVERAVLAAGIGAVGPRAGGIRVVGLAGGYGVVRLMVAGLWVDAVAIVTVAAVGIATAAWTVAHALLLLLLSIIEVVRAAVAVIAVAALRVAIGFVAWKVHVRTFEA